MPVEITPNSLAVLTIRIQGGLWQIFQLRGLCQLKSNHPLAPLSWHLSLPLPGFSGETNLPPEEVSVVKRNNKRKGNEWRWKGLAAFDSTDVSTEVKVLKWRETLWWRYGSCRTVWSHPIKSVMVKTSNLIKLHFDLLHFDISMRSNGTKLIWLIH